MYCRCYFLFFFFFSSRRRHTISLCDWSSDVCSSDLGDLVPAALATLPAVLVCIALAVALFGLLPRWSSMAWALLAVFVLLGELGALLKLPSWVLATSPFDHLGSLPGGAWNATGLIGLVVVAGLVAAVGAAGFRQRDIAT